MQDWGRIIAQHRHALYPAHSSMKLLAVGRKATNHAGVSLWASNSRDNSSNRVRRESKYPPPPTPDAVCVHDMERTQ